MTRTSPERDRYALPAEAPTDEDLRHEAELTRQELGETLAGLLSVMDVKAQAAAKLRQIGHTVRTHPIVLSGLLTGLAALAVLWARRGHTG
jgi:hypothetical protein